jgi:hypothetical protein
MTLKVFELFIQKKFSLSLNQNKHFLTSGCRAVVEPRTPYPKIQGLIPAAAEAWGESIVKRVVILCLITGFV